MNDEDRRSDRNRNRQAESPFKAGRTSPTASAVDDLRQTWIAVVLLVVAGVVFYSNTFSYPFVFDDKAYIANKTELHSLTTAMLHSHRPVVDFSFALNYALDGQREWGYHLVNLAIHLAAALALFGIVRRTLCRGTLADRYGAVAWGLGLSVALLWLVHPLQTESVTYVYQRFESLMGLWFLLTFYLFIRAQNAAHAVWWYAGSVATCLLAIGSKEVAGVLPLLLVWYDRAFLASSWRELIQRRWPFYAALGGVLAVLAGIAFHAIPIYRGGGMLEVPGVSSWAYARTQPGAILYYLQLTFWPRGQCLDYMWPVANTFPQIVPPLLVILALLGLTGWCVWRYPAWGFVGGWFFVILVPSSSFIPIKDLAFEHRMYLSLAAVVATVVVGGYELLGRLSVYRRGTAFERRLLLAGSLLLVTIAFGTATYLRNQAYCSTIALWEDIVTKVPSNPRAHNNLGIWYQFDGRIPKAKEEFRKAIELDPKYYDAHYNLAQLLANGNRRAEDHAEAIRHFEICLESTSWFLPHAHNNLAVLLEEKGDLAGAQRHLEAAIKLAPQERAARANFIRVLSKSDPQAAVQHCDAWLKESPQDADVLARTAVLLAKLGYRERACEHCRQALMLREDSADLHCLFAQLVAPDRPEEAIGHLQRAIELQPRLVDAYLELGELLVRKHAIENAISCFQSAVQLDPQNARARQRLRELLQSPSSPSRSPAAFSPTFRAPAALQKAS